MSKNLLVAVLFPALPKDGAGIGFLDQYVTSHLLSWPKLHALDQCNVSVTMYCWLDSRSDTALVNNSDVYYVKASRCTSHVAYGYSIYRDSSEGTVDCHVFTWGTDGGSISSALEGNAPFKVGFMNNLYEGLRGNVEQVPGARINVGI